MIRTAGRQALIGSLVAAMSVVLGQAQVNVLTYHNDNARTGANTNETLLTPGNVNTNTFGKLFKYDVDGYVYAQPLYVSGLNIPGQGTHNVLFVATEHDSVYAFDADSTNGPGGGLLWQTSLGTSADTRTGEFGTRYDNPYADITNEVGVTGTPVIDLPSGTLFVNAFTHEGSNYFHRIHALNITNGAERANSPVLVTATFPGVGVGSNGMGRVVFAAKQQNQRCALTLAGGKLYVPYAGYGDTDPYHGWIVGFDAGTLQPLTNYVFNTTPNSTTNQFGPFAGEAGIWMSGGGLSVDAYTNLYFETGNGVFTATNGSGGTEYGSSFIKLSTTNGLAVADYFTPYNQAQIGGGPADTDLGSSGIVLLPDQPGAFPHLLLGGGKEGKVYLLNRDQFTTNNNHFNSTGTVDHIVQTLPIGKPGRLTATPAWFNGWVYFGGWSNANGQITLRAFSMSNGLLSANPVSVSTLTNGFPGQTPGISANGTNNGILWGLKMANPGYLFAYNATNLTNQIYNSTQAPGNRDRLTNGVKFTVPTVVNGKVYVGSQYSVYAFGLLGGTVAWKFTHFGSNANNAAIAGDLADPDADHNANLLEYAMGSDPNVSGKEGTITGAIMTNHFQLRLRRNTSATELTYIVQAGSALGSWSNLMTYTPATGWITNLVGATLTESPVSGSPPDAYVTVAIVDPTVVTAPGTGSRFYRFVVYR